MKKLFLFAVLFALATGCSEKEGTPPEPPTGISLDAQQATLSYIETLTLKATIEPKAAAGAKVEWESDNENVATVDAQGVVTPVKGANGTAVITAKAGDQTATCTVKVNLVGTVGFRSDKTWEVGSQTWSDVVMASGARKTDFDGGYYISEENYAWRADCRESTGHGDLFSWQAIVDYKELLCPAPWRVPVKEDFWALDKALGGPGEETGTTAYFDETMMSKYMSANRWGGEYGGMAYDNQLWHGDESAIYATQNEAAQAFGAVLCYVHTLYLNSGTNAVRPVGNEPKYNGIQVRCVQ